MIFLLETYYLNSNFHKDTEGLITGDYGFLTGDGTYHQASYATDKFGHYRLISYKSSYIYQPDLKSAFLLHCFNKTINNTIFLGISNRKSKSLDTSNDINLIDLRNTVAIKPKDNKETEPEQKHKTISDLPMKTKATKANSTAKNIESIEFDHQNTVANRPKANNETVPVQKHNTISNLTMKTKDTKAHSTDLPQKTQETKVNSTTAGTKHGISVQRLNLETSDVFLKTKDTKTNLTAATKQPLHLKPVILPEGNFIIRFPENITSDLAYIFNYATTFNGHNETGYRDGSKEGAYFTINRDKIRRTVHYKLSSANNVIRRKMDYDVVAAEDTPNESNDKFGVLKKNEFKWH